MPNNRMAFTVKQVQVYFKLLQYSIGTRDYSDLELDVARWKGFYEFCKMQSLFGIGFNAVQKLKAEGQQSGLPEDLYLKWLGMAAKIQHRNSVLNRACRDVYNRLYKDGFRCCILKGQGNLAYYNEDLKLLRSPGDIDIWVDSGARSVVEYVTRIGEYKGCCVEIGYHHSSFSIPEIGEIELHNRPCWVSSPLRNARMQKWFKNQSYEQIERTGSLDFPIPSADFNAVYQLCHIFNHLFEEGIGLRQLLDYYFVLRALHVEQCSFTDRTQSMAQWAEGMGLSVASNVQIMHTISRFGLKKFAGAVMFVLQTVFAMPDVYLLCPADEREGCFLLNEILLAGNFGQYDERARDLHEATGISRKLAQLKHSLRLLQHYPEETLCTPFRAYHFLWKKLRLWRFERK